MSVEAYLKDEVDVFQAARTFVQSEGFLPAPESAYAVKAAIDLALECKRKGEPKAIAFNISGHGFLDLAATARNSLKPQRNAPRHFRSSKLYESQTIYRN